jgi:L,D-peptidoglycan transpeptidase YkuD (ErfK/YbiS/YcfS/YnhG family)
MQPGSPFINMKIIFSRIFLNTCILIFVIAFRAADRTGPPKLLPAKQLIIVVTDNWNDIHARLYAFEKRKGSWHLQFSFAAVVGERGMGLGEGMEDISIIDAPQKKEGDMKSPAGIFFLGPAFGYAAKTETNWMHMPYVRATDTLVCIDDPRSSRYNQLIKSDTIENDWSSHEDMHRKDQDYKWGLFVQHNYHPVIPGMGSCIFLHIWEGAEKGTAGCTAMEEKNMIQLLRWIRAGNHPLLVQFPEAIYKNIRKDFLLPDL